MKLHRRGFLGFLGGTVVAGPKAMAKAAQPIGLSALRAPLDHITAADENNRFVGEEKTMEGAKKSLKEWLMPEILSRRYREYEIYHLSPDVHSLRSISLSAKVRIQKQRSFKQWREKDMSYLERFLRGEITE